MSVSEPDAELRWKISPELLTAIVAHARACYPREACGILAGRADGVLGHYPARNVAPGNDRYGLAAEEQRAICP